MCTTIKWHDNKHSILEKCKWKIRNETGHTKSKNARTRGIKRRFKHDISNQKTLELGESKGDSQTAIQLE